MADDEPGDGTDGEAADFLFIRTGCPACGAVMRPVDLDSGAVVLRCPRCGQVAI